MQLTSLDFLIIVVYFAGLSLIGIYFSRRQKSRAEYYLGGRQTHWLLAGGSVLATLLSTISYLSLPGEMIRYGVGFFAGFLVLPVAVPFITLTLLPTLRQLPITSAYEYLERRFEVSVRTLTACIFIIRTLLWMGVIIYTASFAFTEMSGWNLYITVVAIGLTTTFYTSAGGLRTVIWTDNLQLLILFGGAVAVPIFVAVSVGSGPIDWWNQFSQAGRAEIQAFSWDPTVRITLVATMLNQFFWNVCTHGSDQVAVQRYLSTPSSRAAGRSLWVYSFANIFLSLLLMLCGLALFVFYFNQSQVPLQAFQEQIAPDADRLMPQFIVEVLPTGVSGLLLAALLAAAMSSLSSGINSISSVVSSDFFERFGLFKESRGTLWTDKLTAVVAGIAGVAVAVLIAIVMERSDWNLLELTARVTNIFVGPIAALFFAGILSRRVEKRPALLGFAFGSLVSLYICFGKEWFGREESISFLWVVTGSFGSGLVAILMLGCLFPRPAPEKIAGLTVSTRSAPPTSEPS